MSSEKEQLDAVNQELADFGYAISHDLRSPLRAITGFGDALAEEHGDRLDEDGREYLGRIRSAAARMDKLLEDFRKLAQVSRVELRRQTVDVTALAESIAAGFQESDPVRDVTVSIERGLTVEADPALLRVALEQLLGNAWKFTRKHPQATIEVGAGERGLFVRDDGAGFDDAYAAKLFIPFQRLHTQGEFEGNGIGLAIVRRIAHRHGGRAWASGAVEKGATVHIDLD